MTIKKIAFTGGGTGGHIYPNIAIYETLREKYEDLQVLYIGNRKGAENRIMRDSAHPITFKTVPSMGMPDKNRGIRTLAALGVIFLGMVKSILLLRKFRPQVVVGSGGYVTAPVLMAAALLKIKIFVHEQNAVPGRMNRFIARFATRIGVSFPGAARYFDPEKVVITGYPLRKLIYLKDREEIKKKFKIPPKNKVIFVFGGSRGSKTINNAVCEILPSLLSVPGVTVVMATGRGYSGEYRAYEDTLHRIQARGLSPEIEGRLIIREYFDNIDEIYSMADLAVCRAGAGTIKEITSVALPSIMVPKLDVPLDHQLQNAREVEKMGGGTVIYEEFDPASPGPALSLDPEVLLHRIRELVSVSGKLFQMKSHLKRLETQDSCDIILKELEEIVRRDQAGESQEIKSFYLQEEEGEKTHELLFDLTSVGNTPFSDFYLGNASHRVLFKLKQLEDRDRVMLLRVRGEIRVNGKPVEKVTPVQVGDVIDAAGCQLILKQYTEKVETLRLKKKSLPAKMMGSSLGIGFSRIFGFLRYVVISALFGAGRVTDIFNVGLTISNLMRRVVAENSLENAFLPVFSRTFLRQPRKKSWEAASSIVNFNLLASLVFVILGIVFTPFLIRSFYPGFVAKGMVADTVSMTRIMFPFLFIVTVSAIITTFLKAFNRFGIAEFSASFFSLGIILFILLFHRSLGLYSLGWGIIFGGIIQLLFLLPFIYHLFQNRTLAFTYQPVLKMASPVNKKYYAQITPITIDVILSKISEVVSQFLASSLMIGAISYLSYALLIFRLPFSLISQAINSVILKEFSERVALFDKKKAKQLFEDGININVFLLLPISILMLILAQPLVIVVFKRGQFNLEDVRMTALALRFFAVGLVGWGIHAFSTRIFSARIDIKTSVFLNFFMLSCNIGLAILLVKTSLTFAGLALATSLSFLIFAGVRIAVLIHRLKRESIPISYPNLLLNLSKTLVSGIFMLLVLFLSNMVFSRIEFQSLFLKNLFILISLSFVGISVYFLSSLMFKNTNVLFFKRRRRIKSGDQPIFLLTPFEFLSRAGNNPEKYRQDYRYKVDLYLAHPGWEVQNVGIKLIGLFRLVEKSGYLLDLLNSRPRNGFVRRNAVHALGALEIWNPRIRQLMKRLLKDPYYEVRVACLDLLRRRMPESEFTDFKNMIHRILRSGMVEEKKAVLRMIGRKGDCRELESCEAFLLHPNSILRETFLNTLSDLYQRGKLDREGVEAYLQRILITSNHLEPRFRIKSMINRIYREIE